MAQVSSGSFVTGASEGRSLTFNWSVESTSIADNYKKIYWTLVGSGSAGGYVVGGNFKVVIDGETVYEKDQNYRIELWNGTVVASGYKVLYHNDAGNKSFSASVSAGIYTYARNVSGSGSWDLPTIPRYPTVYQSSSGKTETTIKMKWSSDSTIDRVWYSTDWGTTWIDVGSVNANSGSYTITKPSDGGSALSPNTTYNVITRLRRRESQLTANSSKLSVTTYDIPHCTSTPDFTIGDSVKFQFYNPLNRTFNFYVIANGVQISALFACTSTSFTGLNANIVQNMLYETIPNSKTGKYKIKTEWGTYTRTTDKGNSFKCKGTEIPTINNFDYIDGNSTTVAITGDQTQLVQNKSTLSARFSSATPNKGAGSIANYVVSCNGKTAQGSKEGTYNLGTIDSGTDVDLTLTATDSRGYSASKKIKVKMISYSNPTAIVTLQRENNYEDLTHLTVDGSVSDVNGKNTMAIKYRQKEKGGSYGGFYTMQDKATETWSLDKNKVFVFNVVVTDAFGSKFDKEFTLEKGVFPFFIDTEKNSLGMNALPTGERVFEIGGSIIEHDREFSIPTASGEAYGWYLALSGKMTGYDSRGFVIAIQQTYNGGAGIFYFNLRCNNSSTLVVNRFHWLTYSAIPATNICLTTDGNNFYLYLKTTATYQQYYLTIIQEKMLNHRNYNLLTINKPNIKDTVSEPVGSNPATLASLLGIS